MDGWFNGVISDDQWKLEGSDEAHRFTIQFLAFPKTATRHVKEALDLLRPERPDEPWTDIWVTKGSKSYKLFINRDQSEQQQRLQLIQRKLKEACGEYYPKMRVAIPKPLYHPSREMQAVARVDAQDVFVITAPTKHGPHRIQVEPLAAQRLGIQREPLVARVEALLANGSRHIDTTAWLG